ncbi:MAG: purine-nucleoside phosphorylase [Streptosporangiaceae bacterium]
MDPYAAAAAGARRLAALTGKPRHDVAVVLGSGWADAAEALGPADSTLPLNELGGPAPSVPGHDPVARSVRVGSRDVLVFLGRVHLYEGHSPAAVVHAVRTAIAGGCTQVVLTNAAGGLADGLRRGQPVLISDQLNLTGASPLSGPPPPSGYASRFTDLTELYPGELRAAARASAPDLDLVEAVYAGVAGPQYETPAEVGMLRRLGADLVGMSTVLEAIAARHLGAAVLGISLVTNIAAGPAKLPVDHEDVLATGARAAARLGGLLAAILARGPLP